MESSALKDFSQLDQSTRQHLDNVYSCLCMAMVSATVGSGIHLFTESLKDGALLNIAIFALKKAWDFTPHNDENQTMRIGILMGFGFCCGLGLVPLMALVIQIDPSTIVTAFFATALIFGCFTVSALYAEQRIFLYLGGILGSGLTMNLLRDLINLFVGSVSFYKSQLYGGLLLLFCVFVIYDTQLIIEKYRHGDEDFVRHSLDFINIFHGIMIILSKIKHLKKKRN